MSKAIFNNLLGGNDAFYQMPDYLKVTKQELSQINRVPVTYKCTIESKAKRVAKTIFAILFFPLGCWQLLHRLGGKLVVPSSSPLLTGIDKPRLARTRSSVNLTGERKYKRITIAFDGLKLDAIIVGKPSTLANGKWVLHSVGNASYYEQLLHNNMANDFLDSLDANAILFNYSGVGSSSGATTRKTLAKAYLAVLRFLEDEQNGIGAKQIIFYGHSLGGGVQSEALKNQTLKNGIKGVAVKSRTFSKLGKVVPGILRVLVKFLGWNISSKSSSKKFKCPEIILQTTGGNYTEFERSQEIRNDGVIPAKASLAKDLLDDKKCDKQDKTFIGLSENHNDDIRDPKIIADKINAVL